MTNGDKYLKDGVDVEELADAILKYNEQNRSCTFYENMRSFWKSEIKPALTEDEKVILRNIDEEYGYIERANDGTLKVNNKSTSDDQFIWKITYPHNHLFQFIKPRRRI